MCHLTYNRLSDKNTVIYLSYESHNDESVECFMTAAAVHFSIEKVNFIFWIFSVFFYRTKINKKFTECQVDVKDHDAVFRTENINIVKLRRKH